MTPAIKKALAACRKAWRENPKAKFAWCCHHEVHLEPLIEPEKNRIDFILAHKLEDEQEARLRNFRPIRVKLPAIIDKALVLKLKADKAYKKAAGSSVFNKMWQVRYDKAWDAAHVAVVALRKVQTEHEPELVKLHNQDWPDNTWNGKDIF